MLATMRQTALLVDFFHAQGFKATYRKDDTIVRVDEQPPGVFYILDGLVKAYDYTHYGEENLLIIRKENEIFPLVWALTGDERHSAYRALTPATVSRVSREDFIHFVHQYPDVLAPLVDMTIEMYRLHSERIMNLEYRSVRERIVSFLLTMARRFGTDTAQGIRLDIPLRHQDIASSVNASRETTTRELAVLVRKGLVAKEGAQLVLPSVEKLQALLLHPSSLPATSSSK